MYTRARIQNRGVLHAARNLPLSALSRTTILAKVNELTLLRDRLYGYGNNR